ncbi:MAG: NAD(P)H-hydrate dehydratase [Bacteroidota bacterium]
MKLLTAEQIKEADKYTIQHEPVKSTDLMERAANACADWIVKRYHDKNTKFKVFAGPGNNGGDGLALARMLANNGFAVQVYILNLNDKFSDDFNTNLLRLKRQQEVKIKEIKEERKIPFILPEDVLIDAMFGSGLSRALSGLPAKLVYYLNSFENTVISIDIPSGLFSEENVDTLNPNRVIVEADHTLTFQFPKISFFFPENQQYIGNWHILPIGLHPEFIDKVDSTFYYLRDYDIKPILHGRKKFSHKGTYGHGLLIAGSYGMMGAAILATHAALRTGIGLITSHIPRYGYSILQTAVPEALIQIDESDIIFTSSPDLDRFTAIGVGPGLGARENTKKALSALFEQSRVPMVIDADAINILAENKEWLKKIPKGSIITPHPKEFSRLVGEYSRSLERINKQLEFAKEYQIYVVVKGAHTTIATPEGKIFFNSTGNPGMATAGSGDVLTGIILSLLAQHYPSLHAAQLGVYIHGLAGDIAAESNSEEAMIASDIINCLGQAYRKLK